MNITIIIIIECDLNKHNLKYKTSHSLCYRHKLFINHATWGEAVLLFLYIYILFYLVFLVIKI